MSAIDDFHRAKEAWEAEKARLGGQHDADNPIWRKCADAMKVLREQHRDYYRFLMSQPPSDTRN